MNAPCGAILGGRCLSSRSYGGCTLGKASMPAVRSVLHFEVPWLSCQIKMCVHSGGFKDGVRRLSLPQTPDLCPLSPLKDRKALDLPVLPAAPVLRASSHQSEMLLMGKPQLPMGIQPLALPLSASPPLSPPGLAERCSANAIRHVGTARHVTVRNRCSVPLKQ